MGGLRRGLILLVFVSYFYRGPVFDAKKLGSFAVEQSKRAKIGLLRRVVF